MVNACLESLLRDDYPAFDVVVVDNTDKGSFNPTIRGDERIRVVREGRRGLSRARNTGIRSARYDILAFIDDDVTVDAGWMRAIASALEDESIAGVTGLVVPAELETRAQREFEVSLGPAGTAPAEAKDTTYALAAALRRSGVQLDASTSTPDNPCTGFPQKEQ